MADLLTLLSYESHIEPAWCSILTAAGLRADVEFSDKNKITPCVDVILTNVKPTGQKYILSDGREIYYQWEGKLVSRVVTTRGKNSDRQASMLGTIRLVAQQAYDLFNPNNLPYHGVGLLKETDLLRGIDEQRNADWSELHKTIKFNILPSALAGQ